MEVYIDKECWDKVINYAKAAYNTEKSEIGGMMICIEDKDGDWIMQDPQIVTQEIGGTTCDLDKEELAIYYTGMAVKYKEHNFRFCWWHSHHTMSAFWSGTDLSSIEEYGEGASDLSFALVVNLKEEYKCRVSVWKPIELQQDVELNIVSATKEEDVPMEILTEVKAKCRTREHAMPTNITNNGKQLSLNSYNWGNYRMLEDDLTNNITNLTAEQQATFEDKYEYACKKVTEYIRQVNCGDWNMHKFKSTIAHTNKQLEPYFIEISSITRKELEEFNATNASPYELVLVTDPQYVLLADDLIDTLSYNAGYGGYTI